MFVRMLHNLATTEGSYAAAEIYEVPDALGTSWVRGGLAVRTATPPQFIRDFLARLDIGAGEHCLFLPFVGEFGHLIMSHVRLVHFHNAAEKIVCCHPGEQVLFPSASQFVTDWTDPVGDAQRVGTMRDRGFAWPELLARFPGVRSIAAGGLTPTQELIAVHPEQRIPLAPKRRGLHVDVCLGVRQRSFCPERNWPHWQTLADALTSQGLTFAVIGAKATAPALIGQTYHSGDFDTDAAVELLQGCRLYVGTDSGNSHLASTVGVNMLVFREEDGGSRNLVPRMEQVNPGHIAFLPDGWGKPDAVVRATLGMLGGVA